jgi:hypothetical protein
MRALKLLLISLLVSGFTILPAQAGENATTDQVLGEKLLRQVWVDMKTTDMAHLEKSMAHGFQAVHQYGANDRAQELTLIKGLKLGPYTLSDIRITRNGPVIVATYFVSVAETIKGERLHKKPAPRLSVFVKGDDGWQWIAHANLKPMK